MDIGNVTLNTLLSVSASTNTDRCAHACERPSVNRVIFYFTLPTPVPPVPPAYCASSTTFIKLLIISIRRLS